MNTILITIISLCAIGIVSAVILYIVAQKFHVEEDPRIDTVEGLLPGANCGGCGYPGCRGLAEAIVKANDMEGLFCPVGGTACMKEIATALGREVSESAPKTAVVRCNGSCANRPRTDWYDGAPSCAVEHALYAGDTACTYGCLGCGDCVEACTFDAIHMEKTTGLPVVTDACVACGACVKSCPRSIIELRNRGPKERRIFVACVNKEKGGVARKACSAACIGCSKCVKECAFEAISIEKNLAYIDFIKCRLCRKCVAVCPTGAIHEINFPARKITPEVKEAEEAPEEKNTEPAAVNMPVPTAIVIAEKAATAGTIVVPEDSSVAKKAEEEKISEEEEVAEEEKKEISRKADRTSNEEIDFKI